jgi:lysophospholipase L1-like esterase
MLVLTALSISAALTMAAGVAASLRRFQLDQGLWYAFVVSSLSFLGCAFVNRANYDVWTAENALIAWLLSLGSGLTVYRMSAGNLRQRWLAAAAAWAHMGALVWLGTAYVADHRPAFNAGLVAWVLLCVMTKRWFQLPAWGIQVVNTWILFLTVIPSASFLIARLGHHLNRPPALEQKPYSYESARRDPRTYSRWNRVCREEGNRFYAAIFEPGDLKLRPGARTTYFDSAISINSKGFRGEEIPEPKGDAYRIVALGESTTFGITMEAHDRPWPERLQALIQERIKPSRPVQVINAGIPGWSLYENLPRLRAEILALKPDMILSYHGYNGFRFIYDGMPPIRGRFPPSYQPRPVKILADAEYAWVMRQYRKQHQIKLNPRRAYVSSPLESQYADLYRQLISFVQSNRLQLALATYSMAVNEQSPDDLKDFYRQSFQGLEWQIKANAAHSVIVKELARLHPEISFVDTQPILDGKHGMFTDLVHFSTEGKREMAKLFFEGIRDTVETDLNAHPVSDARVVVDGQESQSQADTHRD